jgi:hypothetical protein
MTPMRFSGFSRRLILTVPLLLAGGPGRALPGEDPPKPHPALQRINIYCNFMNRSRRAVGSYKRYKSWVNWDKGPGRQPIIYGLYDLYADALDRADEVMNEAGQAEPISPLDEAMITLVASYRALAPVVSSAAGYYERQDFEEDSFRQGQALHQQLVPAFSDFIERRRMARNLLIPAKTAEDKVHLAAIEASNGQDQFWHMKRISIAAGETLDALPLDPQEPVIDLNRIQQANTAFAAMVKDLKRFTTENRDQSIIMGQAPEMILAASRDYRSKLAEIRKQTDDLDQAAQGIADFQAMLGAGLALALGPTLERW